MRTLLIIFSFAALFGCKSIQPVAPDTKLQKAPLAVQPASVLVLPVSINLSSYYLLADKQVPKAFDGNQNTCEGVSFTYHFDRDPLKLTGNGNAVTVDVTGKYRIQMSYCPECTDLFTEKQRCLIPRIPFSCGIGEPMRGMKIQYVSTFELTKDYGIRTHTRLSDIQAIDPCKVTVFAYDATDELLKEVRKALQGLAKDIDKQTAGISFKSQAAGLWKDASEPIAVPGYGFVHLQPQKVMLTQPVLKDNVLNASLVLEAFPLFASEKRVLERKPLPDLLLAPAYPTDTLNLITDLHLQYDSLSAIINRFMSGKELMIQKKKVIIDSIHIAGAANRNMIFRVQFSGKKRGTLFLTGEPVFNQQTQEVELINAAFDLKTKSALLRTAKWLFSDRILHEISKASKQDLKPQLEALKKELNKSLRMQQGGFQLDGTIARLRVEEVYTETNDLVVRIAAKGKLTLTSTD